MPNYAKKYGTMRSKGIFLVYYIMGLAFLSPIGLDPGKALAKAKPVAEILQRAGTLSPVIAGEKAVFTFSVKNSGDSDLVISQVRTD